MNLLQLCKARRAHLIGWAGFGAAALASALTTFQLSAQDLQPPAEPPPTNELMQAEAPGQPNQTEAQPNQTEPPQDVAPDAGSDTNEVSGLSGTNGSPSRRSGRDARNRRLNRSRSERSNRFGRSNGSALAGGTITGPASLDYTNFQMVADRNIFDPNRQPRSPRNFGPPPPPVESFTLAGTLSCDKGTFAVFKGSRSQYEAVLKCSDTIAGYKLTEITWDGVKLAEQTNQVDLRVGMQMRREQSGPWHPGGEDNSAAAKPSATNSSSSETAAGGAESDVIKRLMEKRARE